MSRVGHVYPGDIVFHCGRGLMSWLIRRLTGSPWSHVSIVLSIDYDEQTFVVLDVLGTRVVQSIENHRDDHAWFVRSPIVAGDPWAGEEAARKALSLHKSLPRHYPYLELLAYLPILRRTRLGRCLLRKTDQMVCSAMIATAWASVGLEWDEHPEWSTPGSIYEQANRDSWPVTCTKRAYERAAPVRRLR